MAATRRRRREPKKVYSPAYRKRIEKDLGGLTIEMAHARGISLKAARGHRTAPGISEKRALDIRRAERGDLLDVDRAFARRQAEGLGADVEEIRAALLALSPEDRQLAREAQARAHRSYKRNKAYRWDLDPRQPFPFPHTSIVKELYFYHFP